jgi:hypothetical protein
MAPREKLWDLGIERCDSDSICDCVHLDLVTLLQSSKSVCIVHVIEYSFEYHMLGIHNQTSQMMWQLVFQLRTAIWRLGESQSGELD